MTDSVKVSARDGRVGKNGCPAPFRTERRWTGLSGLISCTGGAGNNKVSGGQQGHPGHSLHEPGLFGAMQEKGSGPSLGMMVAGDRKNLLGNDHGEMTGASKGTRVYRHTHKDPHGRSRREPCLNIPNAPPCRSGCRGPSPPGRQFRPALFMVPFFYLARKGCRVLQSGTCGPFGGDLFSGGSPPEENGDEIWLFAIVRVGMITGDVIFSCIVRPPGTSHRGQRRASPRGFGGGSPPPPDPPDSGFPIRISEEP